MSWLSFDNPVAYWWVFLVSASIVNILFWFWTWRFAFGGKSLLRSSLSLNDRSNIIFFSGAYVFGCAFRSVFPRADVQRICLFDTWFSSVFIGRTVATLAELAFVAQWAMVLRVLSRETNTDLAKKISFLIIPLIAIAECFSWYAVFRTHYIGNVVEESLWAVTYTLIGLSIYVMAPRLKGPLRLAGQFAILGCALYVGFMAFVDVPMYVHRLIADNLSNKPLLGFIEGLVDLNTRWVVTHDIADWKTEIPWQTLYFSFAVLVSIALCYVPLDPKKIKKYLSDSESAE